MQSTFDNFSAMGAFQNEAYISSKLYSNHDICNNGTVVFQGTLRPIPLVMAALTIRPGEVLKEILGMVPLLIPLLAGCLGLRKALRILSQILRTA